MTVNYTTLLGLAKPVSGTESGTWGDTVNTNLTDYLDSAVAGTQIISGSLTAVTLSKTTGSSLSQAGTGSTGSSQYQIIRCTGNPASLLTITAPAADKTYVVINATSTSQPVKIVGAGPTTGVTIASGSQALVAWNGSDFVNITPAGASGTVTSVSGTGTVSGLTLSGTVTSSGSLTLGGSITGYLPLSGGTMTGAITFAAGQTVANLASGSAGTIPYQSASGTTAMLAAGTSGQVLTSNGVAAPTWTNPSSGAMVLISSVNAVGASTVSFTGLSSTYSTYILEITNWTPSANNSNIYFRTSTNNGATYDNSASNYTWVTAKFDNSSVTHSGSSTATEIRLDTGNNATANQGGTSGSILIANPSAAAYTNVLFDLVLLNGSSVLQRVIGAGTRTQTSGAVNAVQLLPGSGTVTARCNLYGLVNS